MKDRKPYVFTNSKWESIREAMDAAEIALSKAGFHAASGLDPTGSSVTGLDTECRERAAAIMDRIMAARHDCLEAMRIMDELLLNDLVAK